MYPYLVADIGGTTARFNTARFNTVRVNTGTGSDHGQYQLGQHCQFRTADFPSFEACLSAYLAQLEGPRPRAACVALAGLVLDDMVRMTNTDWRFSQAEIKRQFGFESFAALNDFAALAYSIPHLHSADLLTLIDGESHPEATKAIVGPGTGLGVAALTRVQQQWLALPGEGGHMAYAAQTPREMAVAARLQSQGYVCAEALISGPGVVTLFNTLAELEGSERRARNARELATWAWGQQDPMALEAWELFFQGLGSVAGDVALLYAAAGGVYLGGGILPRYVDALRHSGFAQRFREKGIQTRFMAGVPVYLIVHPYPALIGAAAWFTHQPR